MQYILFDMDGTILDSQKSITTSAAHALKAMGVPVEDPGSLSFFIGPPLRDSFREHYGFDETQAQEAVRLYREYFERVAMFEDEIYTGIPEALALLASSGKTLLVATSKLKEYTDRILQEHHLDQYFLDVIGSERDGTRSDKAEVIAYALQSHHIDPRDCIMIGDRKYDILGAKRNGIPTIGVLYGFGSKQELQEAGADAIVETIEDVCDLILNCKSNE